MGGPAHSVTYPGLRSKTYSSSPTDADGIKTLVATSLSAQTYSGAALNGALANPGPAVIDLPMSVTVTTTTDANTYNTSAPIVITGTDGRGNVITENLLLTAAGGNETIAGVLGFATVTSIAIPAQLTTNGEFTFGVLNTVLDPPGRRIVGGTTAGVVSLKWAGNKTDLHPIVQGQNVDLFVETIVWATTTATPITIYK